ncbi:hypothetical protein CGLAU_11455 [Corynebacterium glaucum]|uniref:DUF732 domain-containing protein n=1 Tax=Corynebacterium glaucum TaxID=187491 RepID=A0A1Q2HZE8_9CORY|nr:DUF732 domain-containing protein [Corynebacterium glaucum]AQQ16222.1 hypothetical protein CGLAU_11455 [Corynebacterium glaucum]WJZ08707.1 hypothetical protein CGLAUT_11260 [Corynebacterium glaucum]
MKRALCLTTATLAAAFTLTACGGSATVDSEDSTETSTTVATAASSSESSSSTATVTQTSTRQPAAPAGPVDQPARELDSVPEQADPFTAEETGYLNQLRENGVNVEGVEDELTVTGHSVCSDETITRDVVAGQLVEQRRTDMTPEAVGQLVTDAARANLC